MERMHLYIFRMHALGDLFSVGVCLFHIFCAVLYFWEKCGIYFKFRDFMLFRNAYMAAVYVVSHSWV